MGHEAAWIQQIADGNLPAFEELFRAYQLRLFSYLFRILNDREAAEEVFNDVMHAVWKGAASFQGKSQPSTWIFGIARHKALNHLRRRRPEEADPTAVVQVVDQREGVEDAIVRKDLVKRALAGLSSEHREVVELTFFQGLSYQEIAEIVGCPVNTVKTRMFYAKSRLQKALQELAASS